MTPGAGTARFVRGVVRGSVRGVSGQLRRCVGLPGDTSVAPTFGGGILRRCVGCSGDTSVAPTFGGGILRHSVGCSRGDGRRGAIYDARCRYGTTRPRHCSRRCTRRFQPIAALRRSSGRHKCRPYVLAAVSCGVATVFRATQVSPLRLAAAFRGVASVIRAVMDVGAPFMTPGAGTARPVRGIVRGGVRDVSGQLRRCDGYSRGDRRRGAIYDARCRHGTTRPRHCARRCVRCFRPIATLRRLSGRHKCRPYVLGCSSAILRWTDRPDAWFGCAVASVVRAVMNVGAPFMTPGAGTARPVRGIVRGSVRDVSGQLRRCVGIPGDTSVALRWAACVAVTLSADALKLSAGLFFLSQ